MTIPLPDTKVQSETLEQVAERIAGFGLVAYHDNPDVVRAQLKADVLSALRNQRAACARLLDVRVVEISNYQTRPYRVARRELEAAARAIREGR